MDFRPELTHRTVTHLLVDDDLFGRQTLSRIQTEEIQTDYVLIDLQDRLF